ncbi:MAG TPA: LLM class flavin-dependent oxidoreductase [Candidatus Binatia bacterium]|nr:LLM class flavin-dependent oxidoreductase [Candidatus Binatia bacterium]
MSQTNPKLSFGLWYAFRNPLQWRRSYQDIYAEIIEQIVWAEGVGYDDVWLTEHHFADDGHAPSPLPQAAAIAVKTKKIRIGTGVLLLPLYHPVRVAEDGATVDILSGGRFELGVGVGYRVEEFAGLGIPREQRGGRANEGLEIIRRLWEGETVTYKGKYFQIDNARLTPAPVQRPRPPIWVGGFAGAATKRAARLGDGYIGTGDMKAQYQAYLAELHALGKDARKPKLAGGHFWLIAANDPEKSWREIAPHVLYQINVYAEWLGKAGQHLFPHMPDEAALKASGILNIVTPETAVQMIKDYVAEVPIQRFYTWTLPPGYPVKKMNEHLELFASKVMPHFR